jgi:hypothetical protein
MTWVGYKILVGETKYACRISIENLRGRKQLRDLGIEHKTGLRWLMMRCNCEHGGFLLNPSQFIIHPSPYQVHKNTPI